MNAYEVEAGNVQVKLCDPYLSALKVRCSQNGATAPFCEHTHIYIYSPKVGCQKS